MGSGSSLGKLFKVTTWGESHGKGLGVVIDGCPSGIKLCERDIQQYLNRRQPGKSKFTTKRKEPDKVEIMSGIFEGKTTGTPISLIILNTNQISKDYEDIYDKYRPGHADFPYDKKYGFRDYRGGGRSSGRETVSRVAAGFIAKKVLEELNIYINTYTISIGDIHVQKKDITEANNNPLFIPCKNTYHRASKLIEYCIKNDNSCGGVVECVIKNMPVGIGEPVFEKLDAALSNAVMSIGGTKGIEFGLGFEASKKLGSEVSDNFYVDNNGITKKYSNNAGGILGGLSDGDDIIFRVAFKPTPSIGITQDTITKYNENIKINVKGRHDPCIVPRGVVVVESMAYITILDYILQNCVSNISNLKLLINKGEYYDKTK